MDIGLIGKEFGGIALVAVSVLVLWLSKPRHGKTAKFVGTQYEPYIVVLICTGLGLGLMMILSGILQG
jgi:hypothetical protein